jgi:hypothetical protein
VPDASTVEKSNKELEYVDPKGPSPKPVEQIAREHGGDAGLAYKSTQENTGDKKDTEEKDSKPKTTGEVVHATGFAAEGGDFDATKPGAGKEADRKSSPHVSGTRGRAHKVSSTDSF